MGAFIMEALESVGRQKYSNWEIIVVDDCGPDDGTKDAISKFKKNHCDHEIKYIRHDVNSGVSVARNTGIEHARGEFISFLDPDDLWKENHLLNHIQAFTKNKSVDLVCSPVEIFKSNDIKSAMLWPIPEWYRMNFPASLGIGCLILPSTVVVKKCSLRDINQPIFDPQLHPCEDWDLWIRLAVNKKSFEILDASTCYYRRHPSQVTSNSGMSSLSDEVLSNRYLGFFINQHNFMMQEYFTKTGYLFERTHGPVFRIIRSIDIILIKIVRLIFPGR